MILHGSQIIGLVVLESRANIATWVAYLLENLFA